jgi:hypothetical protein
VNGFTDYLWELPFQTLQMQNKQNLRVPDTISEEIVCVNNSITSYVDNEYYKKASLEQVFMTYIFQGVLYFSTIYINESQFDVVNKVKDFEDGTKTYITLERKAESKEGWLIFVASLSMIVSIVLLIKQIYYTWKYDGMQKLIKRKPVYFNSLIASDILFCITNIFITCCIYYFVEEEVVEAANRIEVGTSKWLRQLQMVAGLLFIARMLSFL